MSCSQRGPLRHDYTDNPQGWKERVFYQPCERSESYPVYCYNSLPTLADLSSDDRTHPDGSNLPMDLHHRYCPPRTDNVYLLRHLPRGCPHKPLRSDRQGTSASTPSSEE